jgi:hypothetical protein
MVLNAGFAAAADANEFGETAQMVTEALAAYSAMTIASPRPATPPVMTTSLGAKHIVLYVI